MHLSREIYYKELAHLIVEAEKSQDLQFAAGDPGMLMGF